MGKIDDVFIASKHESCPTFLSLNGEHVTVMSSMKSFLGLKAWMLLKTQEEIWRIFPYHDDVMTTAKTCQQHRIKYCFEDD